jgi:hypothetical protein
MNPVLALPSFTRQAIQKQIVTGAQPSNQQSMYPHILTTIGLQYQILITCWVSLPPTDTRSADGHAVLLGRTGTNAVAGSSDNRCGFKE